MATAVGEPGLRVEEIRHQEGRGRRSHGCCRAHCGERGSLFLSSEDERLRVPQPADVGSRVILAARQGVSVYEQNLVAAKRASRRLDEHGRRLERFSNQPTRYARLRSGGYPRVGARPPAGDPTAAPGGRHLSLPGGPRLVFHRRPVPSCRHEFRDHGRDRRSHRCGSAVGACVSNPRRDSSLRHGKRETRIIAFRASSSAPACGDRVRVHLFPSRGPGRPGCWAGRGRTGRVGGAGGSVRQLPRALPPVCEQARTRQMTTIGDPCDPCCSGELAAWNGWSGTSRGPRRRGRMPHGRSLARPLLTALTSPRGPHPPAQLVTATPGSTETSLRSGCLRRSEAFGGRRASHPEGARPRQQKMASYRGFGCRVEGYEAK
jgi:hypothetical protein